MKLKIGMAFVTLFYLCFAAAAAERTNVPVCVTISQFSRPPMDKIVVTSTNIIQRIVNAFPSIIDAEKKGIAVNITSAATVIINGFTIRRGLGARGAGICTDANTIAKIYNCRIEI